MATQTTVKTTAAMQLRMKGVRCLQRGTRDDSATLEGWHGAQRLNREERPALCKLASDTWERDGL